MKRIFARLWLWWHYYCTKHLIKKEASGSPDDVWFECPQCNAEKLAAHQARLTRMKEIAAQQPR